MAQIRPFKAIRPTRDKACLVASRSYVTYNSVQLNDKLAGNPYTFIHILNPDHGKVEQAKGGTRELFGRIKDSFWDFVNDGILKRDEQPAFYLYKQIRPDGESIGLIATAHVDDYKNGKIRVHEQTISRRENLFADYLDVTNFHAEPVLLCHDNNQELEAAYQRIMSQRPECDFSTTDKCQHQLWIIDENSLVENLIQQFKSIPALYIADGHHRSASSAQLASQRSKLSKNDLHNWYMVYLIPASSLAIHGYHRLVKDLGGLSPEEFCSEIQKNNSLIPIDQPDSHLGRGIINMYLDHQWYRISVLKELDDSTIGAQWLTDHILKPILKIGDLRSDPRIRFRDGKRPKTILADEVDQKHAACAFALHPVTFNELKGIADAGATMPPKSTYIEPKLRSGLTIYTFEPEEENT
jgi:uncharacterized protein (DUF1015 family)